MMKCWSRLRLPEKWTPSQYISVAFVLRVLKYINRRSLEDFQPNIVDVVSRV